MGKKSVGPTLFVITAICTVSILVAPLVIDSTYFPSDDGEDVDVIVKKEPEVIKIVFQEEYGPIPPMSRRQMGAINVDPLKNCGRGCGSSIKKMKEFGITIPSWIDDVDSFTLCEDGMGCKKYTEMRKRFLDILQPKDQVCSLTLTELVCENLRIKNVVLMVSRLAIAQGQILLFHHGESMKDWDHVGKVSNWNNIDWEKNLKVIHKWINSPDISENYMLRVVMKFATKHGPNTKKIGARYFGGGMKNWGKEAFDKLRAIGSKKKYKHPNDYGRDIAKCFKAKTHYKTFWNSLHKRKNDEVPAPWNTTVYKDGDILVLKGCFFGKETGGSHATFTGRKDAVRREEAWLKRGITIDLISPEEVDIKFTNAPQPQQLPQSDLGSATKPKSEKKKTSKPDPKKKVDVKKKKGICITSNGKQICI